MQMRLRIECGLDSRSRAGVWPNYRAGVHAVRIIQGGKNEVRIRFENIRYMQYSKTCVTGSYDCDTISSQMALADSTPGL
jgi:hypothetical protein